MKNYGGFIMERVRPQLDLVPAGVRNRPDVSQLSVVEFRCGKVDNLGGRGVRMKKRGSNVCGGSYMTLMTS